MRKLYYKNKTKIQFCGRVKELLIIILIISIFISLCLAIYFNSMELSLLSSLFQNIFGGLFTGLIVLVWSELIRWFKQKSDEKRDKLINEISNLKIGQFNMESCYTEKDETNEIIWWVENADRFNAYCEKLNEVSDFYYSIEYNIDFIKRYWSDKELSTKRLCDLMNDFRKLLEQVSIEEIYSIKPITDGEDLVWLDSTNIEKYDNDDFPMRKILVATWKNDKREFKIEDYDYMISKLSDIDEEIDNINKKIEVYIDLLKK